MNGRSRARGVGTRLCWAAGALSAAGLSRGGLEVLSQAGPAAGLGGRGGGWVKLRRGIRRGIGGLASSSGSRSSGFVALAMTWLAVSIIR